MRSHFQREAAAEVASADPSGRRADMLLAISSAVVHLHKKYFGKGPTKARAYYEGDAITCVLYDVHTRTEQTLLASGRADVVLRQRSQLQEVVRREFVAAIEDITGREVLGFFSGYQPDPDISVEVFVLAPELAAAPKSADSLTATAQL